MTAGTPRDRRLLGLRRRLVGRHAHDSRKRGDRLAETPAFPNEERRDEAIGRKARFPDEGAQSGRSPEPAEAGHRKS